MALFIFAVIIIAFIVLQYRIAEMSMRYLSYICSTDSVLVEPDEAFCFESSVTNAWRLPVLYVGLYEQFEKNFSIEAAKKEKSFFGDSTRYHFIIGPNKTIHRKIELKACKRGEYAIGRVILETGDILGVRTSCNTFNMEKRVVVKPKRSDSATLKETLGGYLGDEIVRRFILEDPVLNYGYREYTGHEPMKSIAWKQTARTGRMYVKEYDHTCEKNAGVILDIEKANEEEIENCFEIARMVCEELEKKQISYDFYSNAKLVGRFGNISWMPEGLGRVNLNNILYAMGRSDGTCLFGLEYLLNMCETKRKSAKGYIVITPKLLPEKKELLDIFEGKCGQRLCILEGDKT